MVGILGMAIFILGYIFITLEHKVKTHKSAVALVTACALWLLVSVSHIVEPEELSHLIAEAGTEVFNILIFLLAAMTLVEILVHYNFFDLIRNKLAGLGYGNQKLFLVIGTITFFFSAVLDNLTITIVMIQIARRFFRGENLLKVAAGIVILANAGGAWSPIGDVTTIMIWLADKFTALEIIKEAFIPSAALAVVSGYMLMRQVDNADKMKSEATEAVHLTRGEKLVIGIAIGSFTLPITMNYFGLQPYFGLLLGLGLVWLLIEYAKVRSNKVTHLEANIDRLLQKADISSLKFFTGILLAVSALHALGVLETISHVLFGEHQESNRVIIGNIAIGALSSIVDNVPLTALSIDIIKTTDVALWVLLAITVGTGGSFLVIGSVAGVVAMGMVKELTFEKYLKYATVPAIAGYIVAVALWYAEYRMFG